MKQNTSYLLVSLLGLIIHIGLSTAYVPLQIQQQHETRIIPFCTSFPLTGEHSIIGRQMLAGVDNYLREYKHFTTEAPSAEHPIVLKHAKNNKEETTESIVPLPATAPLIVGAMGLDAISGLLPQIDEHKALLLFPLEGDTQLRQHKRENIIYFRPSYDKELRALVDYTLKTKHKTSIAVAYESSRWGRHQLDALTKLLADNNITPVATAAYAQGTIETEEAVKAIVKASPNVIFCLAQPRAAYSFISNALNTGLHECLFMGLSQLAVIQKLLKTARGLDLVVTSVVPDVKNSSIAIVAEYKKTMQSFLSFRDDSPFYFEAFISMSLLEACLQKITGPITIPSIIKACESFDTLNFKGIKISFNQADRSLSSAVWINPGVDQDWIAYDHA